MTTLVTVQDVAKDFRLDGGGHYLALKGIDLDIRKGEFISLIGHSGCGKSTVARAITRVVKPSAGTIDFDGQNLATAEGRELHELRRRVQMIFQDPISSLNPRRKVRDIVTTAIARDSRASVSPQPLGIEWQGVGIWPEPAPGAYYDERAYMSTVDATHGLLVWSFS